jgi:purine-nucleoside phosphorylase
VSAKLRDRGDADRDVERAAKLLERRGAGRPSLAVVLGSGLSSFGEDLEDAVVVPYADVPGMPAPAVSGHAGSVVAGRLGGRQALVFSGRVHHYENRMPAEVTFAVRLVARLGVPVLVVTNAAGGLDPGFEVGDLMLIRDQISMISGPRRLTAALAGGTFRMGEAYSERLQALARVAAAERGIRLREGVYLGSLGPTYETPAEIGLARTVGASAVGMSTVPEVQMATARGLEVLGISLITNVPLPGRFHETTHKEVLAAGREGGRRLLSLVSGVAEKL